MYVPKTHRAPFVKIKQFLQYPSLIFRIDHFEKTLTSFIDSHIEALLFLRLKVLNLGKLQGLEKQCLFICVYKLFFFYLVCCVKFKQAIMLQTFIKLNKQKETLELIKINS